MTLSVVIITKNEDASIQRCLESVAWADEIIVLDSGSTDRTVELSKNLGARVGDTSDWPGFGPQKNRALSLARRSVPMPAPCTPRCGVGDQGGRHAVHATIGYRDYVVRLR